MGFNSGTGKPMIERDDAGYRVPLYYTNSVGGNVPIWDNVGETNRIVVEISTEDPGNPPYGTYWTSFTWASILIPDALAAPQYNSFAGVQTRDAAANPINITDKIGFEPAPDPFVEPILFTSLGTFHTYKLFGDARIAYLRMDWFKGYNKRAEIRFALMWYCTSASGTYASLGLPPSDPSFGFEIKAYYEGNLSTAVTKTGNMPFLEAASRRIARIGDSEKVATISVDGQGDIVII